MESLLSLSPEELQVRVVDLGGKPFHAKILRREVLERGVLDYGEMTSLSKELRTALERELPILTGRELDRVESQDGTTKLLIGFTGEDGLEATVETVHIPSLKSTKGATLCVSTQVGCPVRCPFCASGRAGLVRNLNAVEIIEQYLRGRAVGPVARSVVMGIGEPLLNYESTAQALRVIHEEFGLGARKITLSTVGFPERLDRIAPDKPPFQLAISLHSPDDNQRARLVPAMAEVSVEDILYAGDRWFEVTGREVTYEYVLLGDENDSPGHAHRLTDRLIGRRCSVNLIPFNPVDESGFRRPDPKHVEQFCELLNEAGVVATVRWSRGMENDAACGQLRVRQM